MDIGQLSGIYYGDLTILKECSNRRIHAHRVFKSQAARGKNSMGWLYGLKLFLVINAFVEIMDAFFSPGNVAGNNLGTMAKLFGNLKGYAFADKGFINAKASESLMDKGLLLITKLKKNMKNKMLIMGHKCS